MFFSLYHYFNLRNNYKSKVGSIFEMSCWHAKNKTCTLCIFMDFYSANCIICYFTSCLKQSITVQIFFYIA